MSTLHYQDLLRAMEIANRPTFDTVLLPPPWAEAAFPKREEPASLFGGIGIKVIPSLSAKLPARTHKRRRWMSASYHRRIQKKWNKRFGYVPAAFMFDSRALFQPMSFAAAIFDR